MDTPSSAGSVESTRQVLSDILLLPGAVYCGVVDQSTGEVLAEVTAASSPAPEVIEWAAAVAALPNTSCDHELHDVMITSRDSYHLARRIAPTGGRPVLAVLVLDREVANLAVARRALATSALANVLAAAAPARVTAPSVVGLTAVAAARPRLPRRSGSSRAAHRWPPPQAARPPEPPDPRIPAPRWANDMSTMRQLLVGLRSLRPI